MESVNDELKMFKSLVQGISELFGDKCEVVLHDLKGKSYENSIIDIKNGHITGRKVGDCGTNLGLEVIRGNIVDGDRYNYVTKTPDGKTLRSTTTYIRDSKDEVIGSICINFDISDVMLAQDTIASLITGYVPSKEEKKGQAIEESDEIFCSDVNTLLDGLIKQSIDYVGKPVANMEKEDKIKGLKYLDKKGAFLVKKSGDRIAKFYDISKYTIYTYLEA